MASTFTPNKDLEMPASGDYENAWATPLNAVIDEIDTSLGGVTAVDVTGLSGGTVLTVTQYRPPNIIFTGTITANLGYFFPFGVGGEWTIFNNTTGPFTIQMANDVGGGRVLFIVQGQRALAISDGTNVDYADTQFASEVEANAEEFATAADTVVLSNAEAFATAADIVVTTNTEAFATAADTVVLSTAEAFTTAAVAAVQQPISGTFTGTLTGFASPLTGTVNYEIAGKQCTLTVLAAITATGNSTVMTMSGLPSAVQPATGSPQVICSLQSTSNQLLGCAVVSGSTITFGIALIQSAVTNGMISSGAAGGGFVNPATKGLPKGWTITYTLD